jgi:hypothetical protein
MRAKYEEIPISELTLDPSNPRIRHKVHESEKNNPVALSIALTPSDTPYRALREAIRQHGGLINPIKVNRLEDHQVVFEGNTRLAIYQDFYKKSEESEDWSTIPCHVYDGLSVEQVDKLRLQDHMIGTREWSAYDKAAYLTELQYRKEPLSGLMEFCGENRTVVLRRIDAYAMMQKEYRNALKDQGLSEEYDFDYRKYTAFEEFQKPSIHSSLYQRGHDSQDFANWVAQDKFPRNEHVRKLPAIMENDQAYDAFLRKDSREAERHLIVDLDKELLKKSIPNLCRALYHATSIATVTDIEVIKKDPIQLNEIKDVVHKLTSFIEVHLGEVVD